ncbi:sugar porter family MFS transporter [Terriglobus albidus]|uniref:sugar porter family MFS transporter n=1 Tax=Terriglobus albidus TaxID=1592106 RepID=UPI0021E0DCF2|nr:sugar porter family MFS transporter [Terriglobus albidus]
MRMTSTLFRSTLVGALGGLLFGFDTVVIAGTTGRLTETFHLSAQSLGITVSIALWGTVIGCILAGPLGQRSGGRNALRLMAVMYIVSALGCALAWNWPSLLVFRFIGGLGIGGSSVLGPVYIAELAPARWRGRLVGTFQANIVLGILLAYISNWWIARLDLGAAEWRWQLGIAFLPALLFLVLLYTIPQSSRFLITRNSIDDALAVLRMMGTEDPQAELNEIRSSLHQDTLQKKEPLFQRSLRLPIFLAISIGFFNQLSGINAVLYYANDIFAAAGLSRLSTFSQSIYIGLANLAGTVIGMLLIDKLGRKTLLLLGAVGTCACLLYTAILFRQGTHLGSVVWLLVTFIGFFGASQGAVIWVYISEIFPTKVRSKGQSLGGSSHWIMDAIIAALFPLIVVQFSRSAPFFFFAAMTVVQFFVVLFIYPETKGATLEQLQVRLER